VRCALAGICLPDETNFFAKGFESRPLNPSADPALPLYVNTPGARVKNRARRSSSRPTTARRRCRSSRCRSLRCLAPCDSDPLTNSDTRSRKTQWNGGTFRWSLSPSFWQ
jgi:hypothetical protein